MSFLLFCSKPIVVVAGNLKVSALKNAEVPAHEESITHGCTTTGGAMGKFAACVMNA